MTNSETQLLVCILDAEQRVKRLISTADPWDWRPNDAGWRADHCAKLDWQNGIGVRISGDWLGNDPAGRKARSRGLKSLEAREMVETTAANGVITTHVRLTDAGRAAVEALKGQADDEA